MSGMPENRYATARMMRRNQPLHRTADAAGEGHDVGRSFDIREVTHAR